MPYVRDLEYLRNIPVPFCNKSEQENLCNTYVSMRDSPMQ